MDEKHFTPENIDMAWCPGCGDFGILKSLKKALAELEIAPENLVMVSGIGQAAKIPQYLNCHYFNGLHGRALSPATAIQAVNPHLTVIAESGDGDMYGEGGNHFIHTIRRNPNITNIVHNNMVYGLTKGQASPTSRRGFKTPVQVAGVLLEPFNPLAVAIALDASFVARTSITDPDHTKAIIKQAIRHEGYSLVDILQPCVSFNKINTYQWFKDHAYPIENHDPHDRRAAFDLALQESENGKLPLGVLYVNPDKVPYHKAAGLYESDSSPLWQRPLDREKLCTLIAEY